MQDRQLYEQILGIRSPWYVERVELQLDPGKGAVRVYLEHQQEQRWPCPECGRECALYDHRRGATVPSKGEAMKWAKDGDTSGHA